jgi:hypothetical protein
MTDISGPWLGTYWQAGEPTRFEATWVQGGNILSGSILDDSSLGEAHVTGQVMGRRVEFTKRYLGQPQSPVAYRGELAESGTYISGQWQIQGFDRGPWEAHRSVDDLTADLRQALAKRRTLTAVAPAGTEANLRQALESIAPWPFRGPQQLDTLGRVRVSGGPVWTAPSGLVSLGKVIV